MLFLFHLSAILIGYILFKKYLYFTCSILFQFLISIVLGLLISLPTTYLFAILLKSTGNPINYSVYLFIYFAVIVGFLSKRWLLKELNKLKTQNVAKLFNIDLVVIILTFLVSTYIMNKSFIVQDDGTFLIARNALFDFGHSLSITRSMSWGNNLPYTSPFVSGTVHVYHFIFQFWAAVIEGLGASIQTAVNLPSIISFWLYLMTLYVLGKELFGKKIVGVITLLFALFHSGLMFVPFVEKYGLNFNTLWNFPNYMFAGPTDGSVYSLFFTLNVFVNQRHLGFALSAFLIIYYLFYRNVTRGKLSNSSLLLLCLLIATFFLWHVVLWLGLVFVVVCLMFLKKKYKLGILTASIIVTLTLLIISPWTPSIFRLVSETILHRTSISNNTSELPNFNVLQFGIYNFGLLGLFTIYGLWISKRKLDLFLPIFILLGLFILRSVTSGLIDQKFLSLLLVMAVLFSAHGYVHLFLKRKIISLLLVLLFPLLIASGLIDFMVLKNDYLYPVKITQKGDIVDVIRINTKKDDVIYSIQNIFDPVVLAGRKNYLGFFQQPSGFLSEVDKYRKDRIQNLFYSSNTETFRYAVADTAVDFILLPKNQKNDIPYNINFEQFRQSLKTVYEDQDYILLSAKKID